MTAFRADLGALEDLVVGLAGFEQRAEAVCAEVDARVRRLHVEWTGWAASEHLAAHRQWMEGAARMRSAVDRLRSAVAGAHGNYASAAAANVAMWG